MAVSIENNVTLTVDTENKAALSKNTWKCAKCGQELKVTKTVFSYLGHTFSHEVPVCPGCGRIFISKELAEGRMAEVEALLEDK